ncbi:Os08g0434150, partial [Oryza sativa Japonica Group]
ALERRELDPIAAGAAAGGGGAVDEALAGGVHAEVELVQLAVAGLVAVALHERLGADAALDGALDLGQRVVAAVGRHAAVAQRGEHGQPRPEAERRLEVAVLVAERRRGAGAVLLPLVRPEPDAVVARARQRRPLRAHAPQQVAHLNHKGRTRCQGRSSAGSCRRRGWARGRGCRSRPPACRSAGSSSSASCRSTTRATAAPGRRSRSPARRRPPPRAAAQARPAPLPSPPPPW